MGWATEARKLLGSCARAMNEKLAADNHFNILGWEERFRDAYREAINFEYRLRQAEADTIFEFVRERPIEYTGSLTCPYCGQPATQLSHRQTLVGGEPDPNHHWRRSKCQTCNREFVQEHKDNYVWYTAADDGQYVLCGLPTCFESYKLTCSKCSGTVVREYRQLDGTTPLTPHDGMVILSHGPDGPAQRSFLVCHGCGRQMEYQSEHWRRFRPLEKEPANAES